MKGDALQEWEKFLPIAYARGYEQLGLPDGSTCLSWTSRSDLEFNRGFDELFETRPSIEYWPGAPCPQFNFLKRLIGSRKWQNEAEQAFEHLYETYVDPDSGYVREDRSAPLTATYRVLNAQLKRDAQRLRNPFRDLKKLLKVVVVETEMNLSKAQRDSLRQSMRSVWNDIVEGGHRALVEALVRNLAITYGTPGFLIETQLDGVSYFLTERDLVLDTSVRISARWWAYETLMQALMMRGQPPEERTRREAEKYAGDDPAIVAPLYHLEDLALYLVALNQICKNRDSENLNEHSVHETYERAARLVFPFREVDKRPTADSMQKIVRPRLQERCRAYLNEIRNEMRNLQNALDSTSDQLPTSELANLQDELRRLAEKEQAFSRERMNTYVLAELVAAEVARGLRPFEEIMEKFSSSLRNGS